MYSAIRKKAMRSRLQSINLRLPFLTAEQPANNRHAHSTACDARFTAIYTVAMATAAAARTTQGLRAGTDPMRSGDNQSHVPLLKLYMRVQAAWGQPIRWYTLGQCSTC